MENHLKLNRYLAYRVVLLLLMIYSVSHSSAQTPNTLCSGADPFCTGTTYDFPTNVDAGNAESGPDYGCLCAYPNPVWYYLKIATSGNLIISIASSCGDVDYAAWGPFSSLTCSPSDMSTSGSYIYEGDGISYTSSSCEVDNFLSPSGNMVDCAYSTDAAEVLTIPSAVVGQYYILMITNYANCSGNITFEQTGGTGATDCSIIAPPITNNGPLCEGQTLQLTVTNPVTGATYSWTGPNGFTSNLMNPTITNVTEANEGTYSLVIIVDGVSSAPVTTTVVINPNPVVTATASPYTVCVSESSTLTASGASTYLWMPGSLTGASVTVAPSTSTTYSVTGTTAEGCTGSTTVTVTVNSNASVSVTASPSTICLGESSTLTGTGAATYSWMPGSLSGTSVSVSPTVATTYTVNGTTANGCTGSNTVTVNVNPIPTVNSVPDQTYCNDAVAPLTSLSGPISGTSFTWTNSNTAVGLGANGIGNPPSFTAINTTTSPITATITITPTASTCVGPTLTYTIMVNPTPTVTTVPNQVYCNGAVAPSTTFSSPVNGTSFTWINSNASVGLGSSGSGNPPSFTATNSSSSPATATVTITPTANACTGPTSNYTITVNPTPTVTVPANSTYCNGAVIPAMTFTSPTSGTTYSWTNSNTSIGLAVSGSGNIAAFTATNTTTAAISATITVTPSANNCTGTPSTYTITVIPSPTVTVPSNTSECTGTLIPGSTFTSNIAGTTYSWTNSGPVIGLAASGVGDVPSFTATNTSTVPFVATIVVTPSANGCTGPTSSYTITVNPSPVITFVPVAPICYTSPSFTLSQASPAGGTYSGPGVTGSTFDPAAAGLGTHTITYNYTNPATGCSNSATMQIVVSDGLTITVLPNNPFICNGDHIPLTAGGASSFTWLPAAGLSATNVANVIASPTITTTYTVTGSNPNGCIGSTTTTVFVYDVPVLGIVAVPDDGCEPLFVNFNYFTSGPIDTNTLHWNFGDSGSPDNNSTATAPSHNFLNDGSYAIYLSALTTDGCLASATDTVRVYKMPIADFYANPEVGYEDYPTINLIDNSVGADSWLWNFGDPASLNNNYSDIQNPLHIFTDTGTYIVQLIVSTSHNCSDTIQKPLIIYPSIVIYIPNAFTPDNDQCNDIWKPVISGADQKNYQLYVFDRWGKILFYTEDMNEGWDGSNKGKKCKEEVYIYMIMYKSVTGKEFKVIRGAVTLVK